MPVVDAQDGVVASGLPATGGYPESFAAPLLTYQDAYEHLLDVHHQNGKDISTQRRRIYRAIVSAYKLLPTLHEWAYFRRTANLVTSSPSNHAGTWDASEKTVTLSAGTWPVDAAFGALAISSKAYPVRRRVSDTILEMEHGPSSDVTGTLRWSRYRYLLPADVGEIVDLISTNYYFAMQRTSMTTSFWWQNLINVESGPYTWSLIASPDIPGRWELWLSGTSEAQDIRYLYVVRHTSLDVTELSSGTVSISGDVATFTDSVLTNRCIGAVLRVGTDSSSPTSEFGKEEKDLLAGTTSAVVRPPEFEAIIRSVDIDAKTAVLSVYSPTVTTRGFTISSHIDVNYEGMWELFLRMCEEQYDILTRAEPVIQKRSRIATLEALRSAMIADAPRPAESQNRPNKSIIIVDSE